MNSGQLVSSGLPIDTAPRNREITLMANFAPIDDTIFVARGFFNLERNAWVVEDKPQHGLPSLGLMTVNPISWLPF
jgi:hypothetical protein